MYLIGLGDSWANGAELANNEIPFGAILSEKLDATYIHVAQDASSISHLVLQLKSAITQIPKNNQQPILAVFLLTSTDRDLMWSKTKPKGTGFMYDNPPPYKQPEVIFLNGNDLLHRDWFVEYHSKELSSFRANTTILALQKMCQYHNIQDYWAWAWHAATLWKEIDVKRFYQQGKVPMKDQEFDLSKVNKKIGHPDQAQHRLIAQRFFTLIQSNQ